MTAHDVMALQRVAGNAAVQRALRPVQRAGDDTPAAQPMAWADRAAQATRLAQDPAQRKAAEALYKELIAEAAANVTARPPLVDRKPGTADLRWHWDMSRTTPHGAWMDGKRVDDHPQDHWQWMTFSPAVVTPYGPAVTEGYIIHELDHAAHAKSVYDTSAARRGGRSWDEYWISYVKGAQDPAITPTGAGLSDLPETVHPSVMEFRAYANQLIATFHRVDPVKHAYLARAVVLFLPLEDTDPAGVRDLDADMSLKKALLDLNLYAVRLNQTNPAARRLLAHEMVSAVLFRQANRTALEEALPILRSPPLSPKEVGEAKKQYTPAP